MNRLIHLGGHPAVHRLGWTLLHFLWQGAVIAGLFAAAQTARRSSHARYLTGCLALLLMAAAPLVTFRVLGLERTIPKALSASGTRLSLASPHPLSQPAGALETNAHDGQLRAPVPPINPNPNLNPNPSSAIQALNPETFIRAFVLAWMLGVSALTLRLLFSSLRVARLKHLGNEPAGAPWMERLRQLKAALQISRPVRLVQSALVEVPTVVGWLRPVILLPAASLMGLTPAQLETILAHELAHIRRYDYLVNLLQNALETLLFYHPAVWWVSNCVRVEREICCDEIAVQLCGDRLVYAQALTALEQLRGGRPSLALGADGGSLLERIRHLSGAQAGGSFPNRWRAGGMLVAALVAMVFVSLLHHPSSNAKAQPSPQATTSQTNEIAAKERKEHERIPVAAINQTNAAGGSGNSSKPAANPTGLSLIIRCTNEVLKVGDEIPIEFIISNHGAGDYEYSDRNYDRSGRMPEYKLIARTTFGENVPDPRLHFRPGFGGGVGHIGHLHPGASFSKIISLNRWALITEPGRYEVVGTYIAEGFPYSFPEVNSAPISIIVLPRTKGEMHDYIMGLSNQIAAKLAFRADKSPMWGGDGAVVEGLLVKLMYTCSPEIVPSLFGILYETNTGTVNASFWVDEALLYYVPRTPEIKTAIVETVVKRGLNQNMELLLPQYGITKEELRPIIERLLASSDPARQLIGVDLVKLYGDDALTAKLVALTTNSSPDIRSEAISALALNRTDDGVKTIETLLNNPDPRISKVAESAIRNAYTARGFSMGRPLRADDFDAKFQQPTVTPAIDSGTIEGGSATNNAPSNPPPAVQPSSRGPANEPSAIKGTGRPVIGKLVIASTMTNRFTVSWTSIILCGPDRRLEAKVSANGKFRMDAVAAGTWVFWTEVKGYKARASGIELICTAARIVVVPAVAGGGSDQPLDLGTVELAVAHSPQIGELVLAFEVKTTDGKTFRLADHRGQYVLLDFEPIWETFRGSPNPFVAAAWDAFGKNDRLALLTIIVPPSGMYELSFPPLKECPWPRADLLELPLHLQYSLRASFGLPPDYIFGGKNFPGILLIGPDGKIVARELRGDGIKAAIAKALAANPTPANTN